MADYSAVITANGETLFSNAAVAGGTIYPVAIICGDGAVGATDPATLEDLVHVVATYNITSSNALVPYQSTYQFIIDSTEVTTSYALREVGLFAKLGEGGVPVMVAYHYTTDPPDTISPSGPASAVLDYNSLTITFSSTPNTVATISPLVPPALHAVTHLQRTDGSSTDPLPVGNVNDVGLIPKTPDDPSKVLVGTTNASWASVPRIVGEVIDYAGATPPPGWLICDGSTYNAVGLFANLFAVIGYSFGGSGDTFNVPDLRGRMSLGAGTGVGLTNRSLAASGGEETHILSVAEMPSHNHSVTDPGHVHPVNDNGHTHSLTQSQHSHALSDPGHAHTYYDPGHAHGVNQSPHSHGISDPSHAHLVYDPGHKHIGFMETNSDSGPPQAGRDSIPKYGYESIDGTPDYEINYGSHGVWRFNSYTSTNPTGVAIYGTGTGIGIQAANANLSINGAATGLTLNPSVTNASIVPSNANITVNAGTTGIGLGTSHANISLANTGNNVPANNMSPYTVLNKLIKY
jgi:microcystin-dependent protein